MYAFNEAPKNLSTLDSFVPSPKQVTFIDELKAHGRVTGEHMRRSGRSTALVFYGRQLETKRPIVWIDPIRYKYPRVINFESIFLIDDNCRNPYVVDLEKHPEWREDFIDLMTIPPVLPKREVKEDQPDTYYLAMGTLAWSDGIEAISEKFHRFNEEHGLTLDN